MGNRAGGRRSGPKCVAIVGPFASGKSTLLEAILARTGTIPRQNPIGSGNTVVDHSAEAKAHAMSIEANVATAEFMGEQITFIDCPGSIEFAFEAEPVLAGCDVAVVVAEADEKKIPALQLILRELEDLRLPRFLFLNKIDQQMLEEGFDYYRYMDDVRIVVSSEREGRAALRRFEVLCRARGLIVTGTAKSKRRPSQE